MKRGHKTNGIILEFLHLGYAAHLFNPFLKTSTGSNAQLFPTSISLSPKDPNFAEWWESHKSHWEQIKKDFEEFKKSQSGQEPADD